MKDKVLKILKITGTVLTYVLFVLCLILLIFSISSKRDSNGAVEVFGHQMFIVQTGSMEKNEYTWTNIKQNDIKSIKQYSAVFVELVPEDEAEAEAWYSELKVGDVLTFRYVEISRQVTETHRIIAIEDNPTGGRYITLRGDNGSDAPDTWGKQFIDTSNINSPNYVIGKVVGKNFLFGLLVYLIKQPVGIALIIIVPCAILIIYQIIKIVYVLNKRKRDLTEQKVQEQNEEVLELRRRIAELEGTKLSDTSNVNNSDDCSG